MNIAIDYIKNPGDLDKERIVFAVKNDEQLGKYLIAESVLTEDARFSARIKNVFWFPDQELKQGDVVVLYTKSGSNNTIKNEDGSTTYFYYWGLSEPHLNDNKPCVVLFEATWEVRAIQKYENQ
ncbi:MAG: hypothetical protein J5913_04100 [Prevotella sp.]|nr:hypothetical protein [Prevotella sp.]MBQ9293945.1 hypothetical protein [Bacteroidaceae bacterium]